MWGSRHKRAVSSIVSNVLVVGLVIILAMSMVVFADTTTEHLSDKPPTARLETTAEEGVLQVTHTGGEAIPADQLEVQGGTIAGESPERLTAGSTVNIVPAKNEIQLLTTGSDDEVSTVLLTVETSEVTGDESAFTTLPDSVIAQHDQLRSMNLSDPFVLRVKATNPNGTTFTGNDTVTIEVRDHLGSVDETPENRYYQAGVALEFNENGTAYVEFGNSNTADVTYWGLDVNDITEGIFLHDTKDYEVSLAVNETDT